MPFKLHPAVGRHQKQQRLAERAALAGERLDSQQLKLAIAAHDAAMRKLDALTGESSNLADRTRQPEVSERDLTVAARRIDEINSQCDGLSTRARQLCQHPQINAAIVAREAAARARS